MTRLRPARPEAVATALVDLADLGPFFTLAVGETDGAWRPVTDAYTDGLAYLVADRVTRYGTPEHRIAASVVQLGHAARLWSVVLGCVVAHDIVPDLGDLHQQVDGPALRLPAARGWYAPEGEETPPGLDVRPPTTIWAAPSPPRRSSASPPPSHTPPR
ncbi:hypothetical protein [Streptosporangium sp. NPDC002607]